jgi:hypothetical protein
VGFFTLSCSLSYFFYLTPGPDTYFRNLAPAYIRSGFIDLLISPNYQWPGFFLLTRTFLEVTSLPQNSFDTLYYFIGGLLLSSSVFIIAKKHRLEPFWSVVVFAITGYFFLNYQFAPQTIALVFLMMLLQIDYSKKPNPTPGLVLLIAMNISHAFIGFMYAVYLLIRGIMDRRRLWGAVLAALIYLTVSIYLTASFFRYVAGNVIVSLQLLLGLREYAMGVAITLGSPSPFQSLSRLSVIAAALVGGTGLVGMIRHKRLAPQDKTLIGTTLFLIAIGTTIEIIGARALQLAALVAALGAGYFPGTLHSRKIRMFLLVFLVLSSVFPVAHAYYSPALYQPQDLLFAAEFFSARIVLSQGAPVRIVSPYIVRGFFGLSEAGNGSITLFTEYRFRLINNTASRVDYALISSVRPVASTGQNPPVAVNYLLSRGNRIVSYGRGAVYALP